MCMCNTVRPRSLVHICCSCSIKVYKASWTHSILANKSFILIASSRLHERFNPESKNDLPADIWFKRFDKKKIYGIFSLRLVFRCRIADPDNPIGSEFGFIGVRIRILLFGRVKSEPL